MDFQKVFEVIDSLEAKYIRVWEEICNIESPTTFKAGVDAVGDYCCKFAQEFGWKVEKHHEEVPVIPSASP